MRGCVGREDPKRWKKEYSRTEVENGETSDMPGEGGNFQVVQGIICHTNELEVCPVQTLGGLWVGE